MAACVGILWDNQYYFRWLKPAIRQDKPRVDYGRLAFRLANDGRRVGVNEYWADDDIDAVFIRLEHPAPDKELGATGFLSILGKQGWRVETVKRTQNYQDKYTRRIIAELARWTRDPDIQMIILATGYQEILAQTRTAQSRGKRVRVVIPETLYDFAALSRANLFQDIIQFEQITSFILKR